MHVRCLKIMFIMPVRDRQNIDSITHRSCHFGYFGHFGICTLPLRCSYKAALIPTAYASSRQLIGLSHTSAVNAQSHTSPTAAAAECFPMTTRNPHVPDRSEREDSYRVLRTHVNEFDCIIDSLGRRYIIYSPERVEEELWFTTLHA